MNEHKKINEMLTGFALSELSEQQVLQVQKHLTECSLCRNELKRIQSLLNFTEKISRISTEEQICESAKLKFLETAENENSKTKIKPIKRHEDTRRNIMNNSIIKNATAAAIIIFAVLIGIYFSGGSIDGTSIALGKTIENMKTKPWVHSIMSEIKSGRNIQESWWGIESQTFAAKLYWDKRLTFMREAEKDEYTYKEKEGVIYYSPIDYSFRDDNDIVMDSAFEHVYSIMDFINKEALDVTTEITTQDGKKVEVITATSKMNNKCIYEKIVFTLNIEENLLLSSRLYYKDIPEYILKAEPKEYAEELIKARTDLYIKYDYPETGPGSIYDLGAPEDADVIVSVLPINVREIIDKINNLREVSLTRYAAIAISGDSDLPTSPEGLRSAAFFYNKDKSIYGIWRKGDLFRFTQGYFPVSDNMPSRNDIAENVESWFQEIAPVREFILLPEGKYQSHQYHWENVGSIIRAETMQLREIFYQSDSHLIENCWPKIDVPRQMAMQWSLEHIDDPSGEQLTMITRKIDIITEKWYINPDKNYICQKHEAYGSDGNLVYRKEILEYATTESGQFYPRKIQMTRNIKQDNKLEKDVATKFIYLKENPEYPDWIFDLESFPISFQ